MNTSIVEIDPDDVSVEDEDKSSVSTVVKPWNPKDIRITTKTFTIRELYLQIEDGELDLAPDFQRSFVWKSEQQIRLIESILLGIPLPAFYFNQDKTGLHQVVDGVQRLTTIKRFMSNQIVLDKEDLEYLKPLSGQKFSTFDASTKRRFGTTQIVAHVIEPQTPDEVKYDIFNRVNTGGSPLTAQEIRHCMSKGRSRDFLRALVELPSFELATGRLFWETDTSGNLVRNNKRMTDREVALRFCAFYTVAVTEFAKASSLDSFLLEFTRRIDQQPDLATESLDLDELMSAFNRAMQNSHAILGKGAFRRWPPGNTRRGPFNRAIFESQAIALADYSLEQLLPHREAIVNGFRQLFTDVYYDDSVRVSTGNPLKVERRLSTTRALLAEILK